MTVDATVPAPQISILAVGGGGGGGSGHAGGGGAGSVVHLDFGDASLAPGTHLL